jgi:flagellar biosynthesis protein FliP
VTSFTRIVVVLSLLRTALGTATAPPNSVLISLALFLTAFVMAPVFERAYDEVCVRWLPATSTRNKPSSAAPNRFADL